jgi:hypothetical protein
MPARRTTSARLNTGQRPMSWVDDAAPIAPAGDVGDGSSDDEPGSDQRGNCAASRGDGDCRGDRSTTQHRSPVHRLSGRSGSVGDGSRGSGMELVTVSGAPSCHEIGDALGEAPHHASSFGDSHVQLIDGDDPDTGGRLGQDLAPEERL